MKNLCMLIKPSSSKCNLNCTYCFYNDIAEHRLNRDCGFMNEATLQSIVEKSIAYAENGTVIYIFQGGEPTLAGLEFFRSFHSCVDEKKKNVNVKFAIQTNGILVNQEWADLFKKHNYLVGLSLDGTREIHDFYRRDSAGKSSYHRVAGALKILQEKGVSFNVLSVVTKRISKRITEVHKHLQKLGIRHIQYIPAMALVSGDDAEYVMSVGEYTTFLKTLFDVWFDDITTGNYISLDYFDNILRLYRGDNPYVCHMVGRCSNQFVIEADGSVFPCDFYALDDYRLGSINEDSVEDIQNNPQLTDFISESLRYDDCLKCRWLDICRNGCRRSRVNGLNKYCEAYKEVFPYIHERMLYLAKHMK